ncbi:MAG: Rieske (2Fe-2S) protein [Vicinamibacteraceae bacterium]|nr:Rieske (2Fe-2S) protein [Vicinamibacteraceae bacterium]
MAETENRLPPRPAWEADFPIERVEAQHVTRREFAKFLVLVSGGLTVGSAVVAVKDDLMPAAHITEGGVRLCAVSEVPVGETKMFTIPGTALPGILIRPDADTWRAYEQKCTHLSCAVFYDPGTARIECPCHKGAFDARTGFVLQGPPPRPLRRFEVERRGDDVYLVAEVAHT